MELEDLYQGTETVIKDVKYKSAKEFVEPFVDRVSNHASSFNVKALRANQYRNEDQIIYNRVCIEGILDKSEEDNHKRVVGLIYSLDKSPIVKIYSGHLNAACLNMTVFNASLVRTFKPYEPIGYKTATDFIHSSNSIQREIDQLKEEMVVDKYNALGKWVNFIDKSVVTLPHQNKKVRLKTEDAIKAYDKLFVDERSPYFASTGQCSKFQALNAFTDKVSHVDPFIDRFEKSYYVSQLIKHS